MERPDLEWERLDMPTDRSVRQLLIAPDGTHYAATLNGLLRRDEEGGDWVGTPMKETWIEALALFGSTLFVGTEGLGVAETTDKGQTWRAVNKGLSDLQLRSLLVWRGAVFAGTAGGGVFRLSPNGDEWAGISESLGSSYVHCLAASDSHLFASTPVGVYRSDDGRVWGRTGLHDVRIRPLLVMGRTIYAGSEGRGAYKSTDEGDSWTQVNEGLTKPYISSLAAVRRSVCAGTEGGGMFRSDDGGATWHQ